MTKDKGPLIIVSGPSGSGKSTVIDRVLRTSSRPLHQSVSVTTRAPRDGEENGRHYYFWTRARFEQALQEGAFLEHARVHDNYYGTLRSEVEPYRNQGVAVILVIDVAGAAQMRQACPDAISVFLKTPSPALLEERLRGRRTDPEEVILRRLAAARDEEARSGEYTYQVINDRLDETVAAVQRIIERHFERGSHA
jgi:guanylate kinase